MEIEDERRYFKLIVKRYHRAGRREKSQILTEFCANVGLCCKYAIRLLNEGYSRRRARPGRRSRYRGKLFLKILKKIWWVSEWQCGKLLKGTLPGIVPHYESSYEKIPDEERALLLAVSAATIDRVLRSEKGKFRRGRGSTKPGSLLRNQIPISTEVWDINPYRSHDSVSRWPSVGEIWTKKRRRYRDIASIVRRAWLPMRR